MHQVTSFNIVSEKTDEEKLHYVLLLSFWILSISQSQHKVRISEMNLLKAPGSNPNSW